MVGRPAKLLVLVSPGQSKLNVDTSDEDMSLDEDAGRLQRFFKKAECHVSTKRPGSVREAKDIILKFMSGKAGLRILAYLGHGSEDTQLGSWMFRDGALGFPWLAETWSRERHPQGELLIFSDSCCSGALGQEAWHLGCERLFVQSCCDAVETPSNLGRSFTELFVLVQEGQLSEEDALAELKTSQPGTYWQIKSKQHPTFHVPGGGGSIVLPNGRVLKLLGRPVVDPSLDEPRDAQYRQQVVEASRISAQEWQMEQLQEWRRRRGGRPARIIEEAEEDVMDEDNEEAWLMAEAYVKMRREQQTKERGAAECLQRWWRVQQSRRIQLQEGRGGDDDPGAFTGDEDDEKQVSPPISFRPAVPSASAEGQEYFWQAYKNYFLAPGMTGYSYLEAHRLAQLAAELGSADGKALLGRGLVRGNGVVPDVPRGLVLIRQAAAEGSAFGIACLGRCYLDGLGVPADAAEAARLLREAANRGDAYGQSMLGFCYSRGLGVAESVEEAVRWFRLAAEQGLAEAQHILGLCHQRGIGVPKHRAEALRWYKQAAKQGCPGAKEDVASLR